MIEARAENLRNVESKPGAGFEASKYPENRFLCQGELESSADGRLRIIEMQIMPAFALARLLLINPDYTHPMREDVKRKHFSTPLRETSIVACIQAPSRSWRRFWVLTPGAHTEYNRDTDRSC